MNIARSIRNILGGRAAVQSELEAAQALVAEWTGKRDQVATHHADAVAAEAEASIAALSSRDVDSLLSAQRATKAIRDRLEVVSATLAQAEARLAPLVARETEAAEAQRWADLERALSTRRAEVVKVISLAEQLAAAMVAAQAATDRAYELLPVKRIESAEAVGYDINRAWVSLNGEVELLLALASDGRVGAQMDSSLLWEIRTPGTSMYRAPLLERIDANARDWLALSPFNTTPAALATTEAP